MYYHGGLADGMHHSLITIDNFIKYEQDDCVKLLFNIFFSRYDKVLGN